MSNYQVVNPVKSVERLAELEFSSIADFNSMHMGVFWSEAGGPGPWEMHPDEDEILHVLEGAIEIHICPADPASSIDTVRVPAGSYLVVPRGLWHRHLMLERTKELYLSPSVTKHSSADDPRLP